MNFLGYGPALFVPSLSPYLLLCVSVCVCCALLCCMYGATNIELDNTKTLTEFMRFKLPHSMHSNKKKSSKIQIKKKVNKTWKNKVYSLQQQHCLVENEQKKIIVRNLHDNCIKTELNEIEEDNNDGDAVSGKNSIKRPTIRWLTVLCGWKTVPSLEMKKKKMCTVANL